MKTKPDFENTPKDGDDRLVDALLHEHARAGSKADDAFLERIDGALEADGDPEILPEAKPVHRRSHRLAWTLGVAATVALAAFLTRRGLIKDEHVMTAPELAVLDTESQRSTKGMEPLRTDFPPELIEGTPKPIRLPGITPNARKRPVADATPVVEESEVVGEIAQLSRDRMPAAPSSSMAKVVADPVGRDSVMRPNYTDGETNRFHSQPPPVDRERYGQLIDNPWQTPIDAPLSTFSIDVDTASYSNLRRTIMDGGRIAPDSVRLEEMVNYFDYSYDQPTDDHPFAVHVGNAACPWNPDHQLLRVALKGREIVRTERAASNLVFLLDVSGSMNNRRKLPLVIESFKYLLEEMNASDTVSIVVYAGAEGVALPPTACDEPGRLKIEAALRKLKAGGSTNGGAGINLAYRLAKENFKDGGVNRVILATDGDFNVGVTEDGGLVGMVEKHAKSKVFLTVLGFGTGNLNDGMMEAITNKGDGAYHYIDTAKEARRVFLEKLMGTLVTIAKDVKIQVEFNPAQVKGYRLLGYANRMLRKEDFSNDKIDAGDIGSGHTVTAFYELDTGDGRNIAPSEELRYQKAEAKDDESRTVTPGSREWLTVKLRYKQPEGGKSTLMEKPFIGVAGRDLEEADADFRFATSVAVTGLLLRGTEGMGDYGYSDAKNLSKGALGSDPHGRRAEFVSLLGRLEDGKSR